MEWRFRDKELALRCRNRQIAVNKVSGCVELGCTSQRIQSIARSGGIEPNGGVVPVKADFCRMCPEYDESGMARRLREDRRDYMDLTNERER